MSELTIGNLAKRADVHVETLRYYERRGLIPRPSRSISNYRLYPADTARRVRFIKAAQELGFSLREIKELISLRATPSTRCADVRRRAEAKIHEVDEKLRTLRAIRKALAKLVAECSGEAPISKCPILESLEKEKKA